MRRLKRRFKVDVRFVQKTSVDIAAFDEAEAKSCAESLVRRWRDVLAARADKATEIEP